MSKYNFRDLLNNALDDFKKQLKYDKDELETIISRDGPHDLISGCADSNTPLCNYDLVQYAADNIDLAINEPELGPAFDGSPTPINLIAANIYEAIETHLWEWWNENKDGLFEELELEEE